MQAVTQQFVIVIREAKFLMVSNIFVAILINRQNFDSLNKLDFSETQRVLILFGFFFKNTMCYLSKFSRNTEYNMAFKM